MTPTLCHSAAKPIPITSYGKIDKAMLQDLAETI